MLSASHELIVHKGVRMCLWLLFRLAFRRSIASIGSCFSTKVPLTQKL